MVAYQAGIDKICIQKTKKMKPSSQRTVTLHENFVHLSKIEVGVWLPSEATRDVKFTFAACLFMNSQLGPDVIEAFRKNPKSGVVQNH